MKRVFIALVILLLSLILACLYYGFRIEPDKIILRQHDIISEFWQGKPLKIAVLADIHIGAPFIDPAKLETIVGLINVQQPDIILLAGDYVDDHRPYEYRSAEQNDTINWGLAIIGELDAPMGVYGVLGNHDYQYGAARITQTLTQHGVVLLDNQSAVVENSFCLFGIDDEFYGSPSLEGYDNCPANFPIIGLMHNPDSFFRVQNPVALMLAGHTHGGQINLPFIGRKVTSTKAGKPYAYGLKYKDKTPVFISAGIGTSILPARFRAPPEIIIIELQSKADLAHTQ